MIERTVLDDSARVVTERLPSLRSVAVGVWVGTGSRDEAGALAGASHFLEHLLFKGTERWSARGIAEAVEAVGGDMNAFTTQEYTSYYVRVPDDSLELAIDILADIVQAPAFRRPEVESERQVILEEIRMRDDAPDDVAHELSGLALFPDHPVGREVIGSHETIAAMERDTIDSYHRSHYRPANVVWAAAGNLEHGPFLDLLDRHWSAPGGDRPARERPPFPPSRPVLVEERPTEQAHVVLGVRGLPRDHPDRYAFGVLNQVLGGGMASRLFQEVREERGLAYAVYSYRLAFEETGAFCVYAGTAPERAHETLAVVDAQLDRLVVDGGVSAAELDSAKGHLVGSLALSLETAASRMHRIGRSELTLGDVLTIDELVARFEAVTRDDVARVVAGVLDGAPRALAAVGPFDEAAFADRVA